MRDYALKKVVCGNIRRIRLAQGISQDALAREARLNLRYVQRLEAAPANLTLETVEDLAKALAVPIAELLTDRIRSKPGKREVEAVDLAIKILRGYRSTI